MLNVWRQAWTAAAERYGSLPALQEEGRQLSYARLALEADSFRQRYEDQPNWLIGRCVCIPWVSARSSLPELIGLWLAGGVWIACEPSAAADPSVASITQRVQGSPEGPACWQSLLRSSGSMGQPKWIVRGWRQALNEASLYRQRLDLQVGSTSTMLVNPWFGASTKHLLAGLLGGWQQRFGSAEALEGGDLLYGTPSQLLALGEESLSAGFRWISLTGEPCRESVWPQLQRWGALDARCLNAFGASETGVIADQVLPLHAEWCGFEGTPCLGKHVDVVGDDGRPMTSPVDIGRIQVRGDALAEGLLMQVGDGWSLDSLLQPDGTMRVLTADLGLWSERHGLQLLGRSNELLKRHGEWIDLSSLRRLLEAQPEIRRVQLMDSEQGLVAWLERDVEAGRSLELKALEARLRESLGDPRLLPQYLLSLDQFPLNVNGKVDLGLLRGSVEQPERLGAHRWPPLPAIPVLHPLLDSLDHAQLLAAWRPCNLLWCGGGLRELQSSRPPELGLVQQIFPGCPSTWRGPNGASLEALAREQVDTLLRTTESHLGQRFWLGGYSVAAWLSYAMAAELLERGHGVAGVILLDPVNPWSPTYQWAWRRRVARLWRSGAGRWWYRDLSVQQLHQKAWLQELLGQWQIPALNCPLILISGSWPAALPPGQLSRLTQHSSHWPVSAAEHHEVLSDPVLVDQWTGSIWNHLRSASG